MRIRAYSFIIRSIFFAFWLGIILGLFWLPTILNQFRYDRSLTIFTWPLVLDARYLKKFEQKTGIKLYISYYETNEEMLTKLQATKHHGYDLVIPSSGTVQKMIQHGMLKKLDHSKLSFIDRILPLLTHHPYDFNNDYSIPYYWGILGIGYDTTYFGDTVPNSWSWLFDKDRAPSAICMTNDPREAILIASQYLFGSIQAVQDSAALNKIRELLIQQKKWVNLYSDALTEIVLASHSIPISAAVSSDIFRAKEEYPHIDFVVPKEGGFLQIDSFAIPVGTKKDDLIYEFLNFMYEEEVVEYHATKFGFYTPVIDDIEKTPVFQKISLERFVQLEFFENIIPIKQMNKIWIEVLGS